MKKVLLVIMLLFATNFTFMQAGDVILRPRTSHAHGNKPRTPSTPIYVEQNGTTLTFDASCIGCSITLFDENENIVYTTIIDETATVEMPDSLVGIFELQLIRNNIIYVGEIEW